MSTRLRNATSREAVSWAVKLAEFICIMSIAAKRPDSSKSAFRERFTQQPINIRITSTETGKDTNRRKNVRVVARAQPLNAHHHPESDCTLDLARSSQRKQ